MYKVSWFEVLSLYSSYSGNEISMYNENTGYPFYTVCFFSKIQVSDFLHQCRSVWLLHSLRLISLPTELFQHLRMSPFVSLAIRVLLHSAFSLSILSAVIKDDGNDTVYALHECSNFLLDLFKIYFNCIRDHQNRLLDHLVLCILYMGWHVVGSAHQSKVSVWKDQPSIITMWGSYLRSDCGKILYCRANS